LRSRIRLLFATLIVATGLLLGAVGAQAKPSDPPVDFLMEVDASSASFTPIAGKAGEYELVLRGVADEVGVTELTRAETTAALPLSAFMAYWTVYGDETGQFETNPPRAVLQAVDAAGNHQELAVRLSNGSRKGATVRFDAEIITSENVQNTLEAKIDKVDETEAIGEAVLVSEPDTLAPVEMFVDMPQRIVQPKAESNVLPLAKAPTPRQAWMENGGSCNGVYSSRLRTCWQNIPFFPVSFCAYPAWQGRAYGKFANGRGFAYEDVGVVDLGDYYWSPQTVIEGQANPPKVEWDRCFRYHTFGNWYGVYRDASTFYVTDDCTWFMARWSAYGRCW
jgi:hypothetical protein